MVQQIVIFKLEYDPRVISVYNTFSIPRVMASNEELCPDLRRAALLELQADRELIHNNRKINAFADDTNCGILRNAENLANVKSVLEQFGRLSGLETNIEKTTLMPIGDLNTPLEEGVAESGFKLVSKMKTLGIQVNNKAAELWRHFDRIIEKMLVIARKWELMKLSLPGRIAIAKTMLISQIGYGACIFTPTAEQLTRMQDIVNNYVLGGIPVAKDRLYKRPRDGGLGLIDLRTFCPSLQCSWVKRCASVINDTWRWNLAKSCNFHIDMLRVSDIDGNLYPVLKNISESFEKLQHKYWNMHENFRTAPLVDNLFFFAEGANKEGASKRVRGPESARCRILRPKQGKS